MFPIEILQHIAGHLNVHDQARFACVCKLAREAVDQTVNTKIRVVIPASHSSLTSFSTFLIRNLRTVEVLEIVTNMKCWGLVWRYVQNRHAPNLHTVWATHLGPEGIVFTSPEDFFPSSPQLKELKLVAQTDVHVGEGFSRLGIEKFLVSTKAAVTSDLITWVMPSLNRLCIYGTVFNALYFSGIMYTKLKHLECPAAFVHFLPGMKIESLSLIGVMETLSPIVMAPACLKHLKLLGGDWPFLDWVPESLENLEVVGCRRLGEIYHLDQLVNVSIVSTPCSISTGIHGLDLKTFTFRSFGAAFFPFIAFAETFDIYKEDAHKIKCYKPRKDV